MNKYFEVYNDLNTLTIDDSYQNYFFIRKYKPPIYYRSSNNASDVKSGYLNVSTDKQEAWYFGSSGASNSLLFWSWSHSNLGMYHAYQNVLSFIRPDKGDVTSVIDSIIAYEFGIGADTQFTNYGLEVFNENGQRVFNSGARPMKVMDCIFQYRPYGTGDNRQQVATRFWISPPPSKRYDRQIAICALQIPAIYLMPTSIHRALVVMPDRYSISSKINHQVIGPQVGTGSIYYADKTSILVADVSDL